MTLSASRHLTVAMLFASTCGCGGSTSPFSYVPVSGQVSYEDGTRIDASGMVLTFIAQEAPKVDGAHPRPASASVDSEGRFDSVTSYKFGDGLIPGKHRVGISYATDKNGKLLIPKEYSSAATSPLIVDTADAPLQIKVPKR